MQSEYGQVLKISIFGESHQETMGFTLHGLAPGISFDWEKVQQMIDRRKPKSGISTTRVESDDFELISGYFNGYTTGTALTILVKNKAQQSKDYDLVKQYYRPSHADYSGEMKYLGYEDYRGGGHFSGRITVLLVIAGSLCLQILEKKHIQIGTHILKTKGVTTKRFSTEKKNIEKELEILKKATIPTLEKETEIIEAIQAAKESKDSIGGILETVILGLPAGVGEPFFDSLESTISHLIFSVPGVKGLSFGLGFDFVNHFGSEVSDGYCYTDKVETSSNYNGGILGGISTGMPCCFDVIIKPTSTIGKELSTIDKNSKEEKKVVFEGRHDPAIFPRAAAVIEAVSAIAVLDALVVRNGYLWMREEK
jgi:chorismate synthase